MQCNSSILVAGTARGRGPPPLHAKQYTTERDEMQLRCGLKFYFSGACGELQRKRGRSGRSLALPNVVRSRGGPRFVAAASVLSTTDAPLTRCPVVQMGECPMKESFVFIGTSFIRPTGQRDIRPTAAGRMPALPGGGPRLVAAASALSTTDAPLTGCPVVQMGECPMKESFVFIGTSFIRPTGQRDIRPTAAVRSRKGPRCVAADDAPKEA